MFQFQLPSELLGKRTKKIHTWLWYIYCSIDLLWCSLWLMLLLNFCLFVLYCCDCLIFYRIQTRWIKDVYISHSYAGVTVYLSGGDAVSLPGELPDVDDQLLNGRVRGTLGRDLTWCSGGSQWVWHGSGCQRLGAHFTHQTLLQKQSSLPSVRPCNNLRLLIRRLVYSIAVDFLRSSLKPEEKVRLYSAISRRNWQPKVPLLQIYGSFILDYTFHVYQFVTLIQVCQIHTWLLVRLV